jgi:hypothetical protein
MILFPDSAPPVEPAPRPRKWDAEIDKARRHDTWLDFEADIHQSPAMRSRVARALDRYGLGTSDIAIDEALDYITHKELGQSARHFNRTGKAQFNQQQLTHAVSSYMSRKEQQRHLTDCTISEDDSGHDYQTPGSIRASDLADASLLAPDELAARRDTLRAIKTMIPENYSELYDIWLAVRADGIQCADPGQDHPIRAYARRQGIAINTAYFRIGKLAEAIQRHPWFDEITSRFRPLRRAA